MNWVLVAIVAGAPVLTDLKFSNLADCMKAEERMRVEHVKRINLMIEFMKPDDKTRTFWFSQAPSGTCIPAQ